MPMLWSATVEAHRHAVRDAILDATWDLVADQGLFSVTMSQIAEKAGIGRATLYKYFTDVEEILAAGHERHVDGHLRHLVALRERAADPAEALREVLRAYALICHHRRDAGTELGALLHRGEHVARAQQQLLDLVRELLTQVAASGGVRDDVAPDELANYCLHALAAAATAGSESAVERLVAVVLASLRPPA